MFGFIRNFFAERRRIRQVAELAAAIGRMPKEQAPKGKRWCLTLENRWALVDVPKPDPARKAAPRKRKAKARA